jgi:hypothetical protein
MSLVFWVVTPCVHVGRCIDVSEKHTVPVSEILGSRGGKYEVDSLLGYCLV